jgi:hypothetical protein
MQLHSSSLLSVVVFSNIPTDINGKDSSQVIVQARKPELHVRNQSGVLDNSRTAIRYYRDMVDHRRVETAWKTRIEGHTAGYPRCPLSFTDTRRNIKAPTPGPS